MIHVETKVKIPFLWGKAVFKKSNWSHINLIVGPNGSGKTLLAENLAKQFRAKGYNVRFIRSERHYMDQMPLLKQNEKIREKIEKVLSSMFGKSIKFIEDIDGTLIPIVENKAWKVQYMLEDVECHGLREIISLLISLYDASAGDCLFFDEPELHLHPQFQSFFMNEIRKQTEHNNHKLFFLISHSPFFIDLRTPDDLMGVIACHINKVPTTIESLLEEDEALFYRFLPRFNTYHKQFFFSDNQIFVEGYTDQQMFTYLLSFISESYNAAGTGIIDVGGKDELGVFCKVCSLLGTEGRIITDLDSMFSGKLREVFCKDARVINWMNSQHKYQMDFYKSIFTQKELEQEITLEKLIYKLEKYLIALGKDLTEKAEHSNIPSKLSTLVSKLQHLKTKHENAEAIDTYKTVILQGVTFADTELEKFLSPEIAKTIPIIKQLAALAFSGAAAARVYILKKGCIEHYYRRASIMYMPVSGKDKLFRNELEFIQEAPRKVVRKNYCELIELLEKCVEK